MGHTDRYQFGFKKKNQSGKESQYMVSHPELGSDPSIGSDRESERDTDVLTSYVVSVSKMVCFFEVAFDNDLRFPLHPFIKGVLQHFNVCPSQLSPNG